MTKKSFATGLLCLVAAAVSWLFIFGPLNFSGRGSLRNTPDYEEQMKKGDLPDEGDFRGFDDEAVPDIERPKGE